MARIAVIDVGTVTARLAVADVEGGRVARLAKQSNIVNLGQDVDRTHRLRDDAMQRLLACIDGYLAAAREAKAPAVCCTLTSAARDAQNSDVLLGELDARGLKAQVIPGEVEGSLTFLGVAQDFPGQRIMVADNGGGSTELAVGTLAAVGAATADGVANSAGAATAGCEAAADVAAASGAATADGVAPTGDSRDKTAGSGLNLEWVHSINVGCRRLSEKFLDRCDPPAAEDLASCHEFAGREFAPWVPWRGGTAIAGASDQKPTRLIVTGGTATTLVAIHKQLDPYDPRQVHLARLSLSDVDALEKKLAGMTLEQRKSVKGLQLKRAAVIVGGAVAVDELLRQTGFDELTCSESDLLFGMSLVAAATFDGAPSPIGWRPELALL